MEPGKLGWPLAEKKGRLIPGKYRVVCSLGNKSFIAEEMDLAAPRTVKVSVPGPEVFKLDALEIEKLIKVPWKP